MQRTFIPALLSAALLAACASTPKPAPEGTAAAPASADPSAAPAASGEVVQLRFGWKPGDVANVSEQRLRTIGLAETKRETKTDATWTMKVRDAEGGVAIGTYGLKLSGSDPSVAQMGELLAGLADRSALVVDGQGAPQRLDGAQAISEVIDGWISKNVPLEKATPELRAAVKQKFSVETIQAQEFDAWNKMIAVWSGAELELDVTYRSPDPAYPLEFLAKKRTPCVEGEEAQRCVLLVSYAEASAETLKPFEQQMAAVVNSMLPGTAFRVASVVETTLLFAEPSTLRPWAYERNKTITLKLALEGEEREMSIVETTTRGFAWEAR